jgi:selenocysteine lyase/cysteine desulfurase
MTRRRQFFKQLGYLGSGGVAYGKLFTKELDQRLQLALSETDKNPEVTASDEKFWEVVRSAYRISDKVMNLNNGGVSPHPLIVEDALFNYHKISNSVPSFDMWRTLDRNKDVLRKELALLAGCSFEEIAIQRNATEAIETVILGLPLKKGDEVILTRQDYPNMINAWKQREMRDKIKLVWLDFDFPIEDKQTIVDRFSDAITSKTKLLHVTHVINWMGQILPVKALSKLAHDNGAEILVDGAHSFAQFDFSLEEFDCDYFGTSLHKWLGAPFGTGMLFIKKNKIKKVYPLFAGPKPKSTEISKFEHLGTRSIPIEKAIGSAIYFHNKIGIERKEARLRYLKNLWAESANQIEGVSIGTSLKDDYSCGIALLQLADKASKEVANRLLKEFGIHAVAINWHNINGVRITPNVYTLEYDMDRLVNAIQIITET